MCALKVSVMRYLCDGEVLYKQLNLLDRCKSKNASPNWSWLPVAYACVYRVIRAMHSCRSVMRKRFNRSTNWRLNASGTWRTYFFLSKLNIKLPRVPFHESSQSETVILFFFPTHHSFVWNRNAACVFPENTLKKIRERHKLIGNQACSVAQKIRFAGFSVASATNPAKPYCGAVGIYSL